MSTLIAKRARNKDSISDRLRAKEQPRYQENQRLASERRIKQPLVLRGVSGPDRKLITREMFSLLDIDRRYQRDRIGPEVGSIIEALRQGGLVPDPVTLCRRTFAEADGISNKLWIIDGQQRSFAFLELDQAFWADVFEVESLEAERNFFIAMNTRKNVGAGYLIHSWPGASAQMLRSVDANPSHPLYGIVGFKSGETGRFAAAPLIRCIAAAVTGQHVGGGMSDILARADRGLSDHDAFQRATTILRLLPTVFPRGYVKALPMVAVARLAYRRWERDASIYAPSPTILSRLKRTNWDSIAPSINSKFLPLLESHLERIWK